MRSTLPITLVRIAGPYNFGRPMGANQLLAVYVRCAKRQSVERWGQDYQPAIRAVQSEAPAKSWASRVRYYKHRRDLHLFGQTENPAGYLALHFPGTVDIQEQKVLWPWATPHPLDGSPYYKGPPLSPLPGMYETVKRLGQVDKLARIHVPGDLTNSGKREIAIVPFIGDLLLFLVDVAGPYCVNWTIKDNKSSFEQPAFGSLKHRRSADAAVLEALRHSGERENYASAGIRTVQIVKSDLDDAVFANLRCLHYGLNVPVTECAAKDDLEGRLVLGLEAGIPPQASFCAVMHRHRCTSEFCRAVAQRMIWERRLLVDMYSTILFDLPLRPMSRDVLQHYAHWFRR